MINWNFVIFSYEESTFCVFGGFHFSIEVRKYCVAVDPRVVHTQKAGCNNSSRFNKSLFVGEVADVISTFFLISSFKLIALYWCRCGVFRTSVCLGSGVEDAVRAQMGDDADSKVQY